MCTNVYTRNFIIHLRTNVSFKAQNSQIHSSREHLFRQKSHENFFCSCDIELNQPVNHLHCQTVILDNAMIDAIFLNVIIITWNI